MVLKPRPKGDPPPDYGAGSDLFTVEIHHGGFFMGPDSNWTYVNAKVNWFDNLSARTWSPVWFEKLSFSLHYPKNPALNVWWLLPGREMPEGLRLVGSERDTKVMAAIVDRMAMHYDEGTEGPFAMLVGGSQPPLSQQTVGTQPTFSQLVADTMISRLDAEAATATRRVEPVRLPEASSCRTYQLQDMCLHPLLQKQVKLQYKNARSRILTRQRRPRKLMIEKLDLCPWTFVQNAFV